MKFSSRSNLEISCCNSVNNFESSLLLRESLRLIGLIHTNNIILYLLFSGCDKHGFLKAWEQQRIRLFENKRNYFT